MAKSQKKNVSPAIWFLAAFTIVIIVTIITKRRSPIAAELQMPLNNGISHLATFDNLLTALASDNTFYIWQWRDLSKNFNEFTVDSDQSALIAPEMAISLKRSKPDYVVLSPLKTDAKQARIPLPFKSVSGCLDVSGDSNKIFVLLLEDNNRDAPSKYELLEVMTGSEKVDRILAFNSEKSMPANIAVSGDGRYIVAAGEKNNAGWMALLDAKEGLLVWQKEFPEFKKIFRAAFSKDSDIIYARGTDSTLLVIRADSGEIADRLLPVNENKSTYKIQAAQTVVVSKDGRLVAATVFSTVYAWDTATKKKLCEFPSNHKVISSVTFSDDSRYLATSDMRQGGKIVVFKLPNTDK